MIVNLLSIGSDFGGKDREKWRLISLMAKISDYNFLASSLSLNTVPWLV